MKVYRLCRRSELESIVQNKSFSGVGKKYEINENKNNHKYSPNQKYLHFFKNSESVMYLNTLKGRFIAVYDLPEPLLERRKGLGIYLSFLTFSNPRTVEEYAISTKQLNIKNLIAVYEIVKDIDYEDILCGDDPLSFVKKRPLRKFEQERVM